MARTPVPQAERTRLANLIREGSKLRDQNQDGCYFSGPPKKRLCSCAFAAAWEAADPISHKARRGNDAEVEDWLDEEFPWLFDKEYGYPKIFDRILNDNDDPETTFPGLASKRKPITREEIADHLEAGAYG